MDGCGGTTLCMYVSDFLLVCACVQIAVPFVSFELLISLTLFVIVDENNSLFVCDSTQCNRRRRLVLTQFICFLSFLHHIAVQCEYANLLNITDSDSDGIVEYSDDIISEGDVEALENSSLDDDDDNEDGDGGEALSQDDYINEMSVRYVNESTERTGEILVACFPILTL